MAALWITLMALGVVMIAVAVWPSIRRPRSKKSDN